MTESAAGEFDRANALMRAGRFVEAASAFRAAAAHAPGAPQIYLGLGVALGQAGDLAGAAEAFRRTAALDPTSIHARINLGKALGGLGDRVAEIEAYRAALALDPNHAVGHYNLAVALARIGETDAAVAGFRNALRLQPDWPEAHTGLAHALLKTGLSAEGWREYAWRRRAAGFAGRVVAEPTCPPWAGQSLQGKTLLLTAEQGLGDCIHFIRYAGPLAAQGARIVTHTPASLTALFRAAPGVAQAVDGPISPKADYFLPLPSLPGAFGVDLATQPPQGAYLVADTSRTAAWDARLPKGLRVGIVWRGGGKALNDAVRSMPLAAFAPLAEVPGVRLISLQKQYGLDELATLPAGMAVETLGPDYDRGDFAETAAVIAALDQVVTCDTSVAHLAGALGKPTWIGLDPGNDWRWLTGRSDTPWYASVRLYRQPRAGDWASVFARMSADLAKRA